MLTDVQYTNIMIQFTLLENRLGKIQEDIDKLKPVPQVYPTIKDLSNILKGNKKEALKLFDPILPKDNKCLYNNVPPNTPMGLSCTCKRCSAYCSMTTLTEEEWSDTYK